MYLYIYILYLYEISSRYQWYSATPNKPLISNEIKLKWQFFPIGQTLGQPGGADMARPKLPN